MDFSHEQSILDFADTARRFVDANIVPMSPLWDQGTRIDKAVYRGLGELGLLSLRMPEEFGGLGCNFETCGRMAYEVGRGDVGVALSVVNGVMWGELSHLMHPSIREEWTPRVAMGAPFVFTLTEPNAGSDAGSIRTTAKRDGDHFIINGEKGSVSHAGTGEIAVVFARTGGSGPKGISAFMVPWDSPGIEKRVYKSAGERVTERGQVFYTDLRVPAINLLGAENTGFREAMQFFDYNRSFLALVCLGAAEKSLEQVIEYIKVREAFGSTLAKFQGVTFQVAEHLTKIEAAKLLAYKVLWAKDKGLPHSKEAAMIKYYGILTAVDALHACVLLSGWPAYSTELPHEQRMRDVMGLQLGDGTAEIMKMIVARETFGRASLPYQRLPENN